MITVRNLVKEYDGKRVVDGVNFSVPPGEITAYLGPNGAGKSTTIKMIVGLLKPTQGQVLICDHDMACDPLSAKKCLGYVPENSAIYATLTPQEYLSLVADLHGMELKLAAERIDKLLKGFELGQVATQQISTLSRGQRQKVLLSGGLLPDPPVLLLDEPLQGLDANSVSMLRRMLQQMASHGKTILMCSHILAVVEQLCDRILLLHQGRLVADESTKQLVTKSAGGTLESVFCELTRTSQIEAGTRELIQALGSGQDVKSRSVNPPQ